MIRLKKLGFVTQQETAEMFGVTRQTISAWKNKGALPKPALEQNGIMVWKLKDIEKELEILGIPSAS